VFSFLFSPDAAGTDFPTHLFGTVGGAILFALGFSLFEVAVCVRVPAPLSFLFARVRPPSFPLLSEPSVRSFLLYNVVASAARFLFSRKVPTFLLKGGFSFPLFVL